MNWKNIIEKAASYLNEKGVPDAETAGELLAARLLGVGRGFLVSYLEREASPKYLDAMRRGMKRLVSGEPLQYVLGEWDFRTLTLKCDKRALIPRPETEELVTRVLNHLSQNYQTSRPVVVDVGTGTGAIILSLAAEYKKDAFFIGTDISADAIALAKENAAKLSLHDKVNLVVADGLDEFDEPESIDIIVSNPPYIESAVCPTLDARVYRHEPILALDGGASGLDFYDRYLSDALHLLKDSGAIFFEIGEGQGQAVSKLMYDYGFTDIRIEKDFSGHDRFASCRLQMP